MTCFNVFHHLQTLYLFTKADFKTIVAPVVLFAVSITPVHASTPSHFLQTLFWVWLHLLHHDIANQSAPSSLAEDTVNKPYRPLPSGRISLQHARQLRWAIAIACLAWNAIMYGREMLCLSIMLLVIAYAYNDLGTDAHWFIRDITNATAFSLFEAGACLISSPSRPIDPTTTPLPETIMISIISNALLYLTTNFSQDFKDVDGDAKAGRLTIPIIIPTLARVILPPILVAWAVGLSVFWNVGVLMSTCFVGAAVTIGTRFAMLRNLKDDKTSTQMYLGWLSIAHILPAYYRVVVSGGVF